MNTKDRDKATAWEAMANARLKERDAARAEVGQLRRIFQILDCIVVRGNQSTGTEPEEIQPTIEAVVLLHRERDAARAERDCLNSQCDYYKADLDAIRAMVPDVQDVSTQDLVRDRLQALQAEVDRLRELLRATEMAYGELLREKERLRSDLCEIADGTGCHLPDAAEAKRRIIGMSAEVERLTKQRDELAGLAKSFLEVWDHAIRNDWTPGDLRAHRTAAEALRKAIAAEQPKPARGA